MVIKMDGGNSLPKGPLPSGNVIGAATVERESKPDTNVPGDWSFKVKNNGDTPWPAGTIFTLDKREIIGPGITDIEIPVGEILPSKFYTVKGIDIYAPKIPGEYKYYFSFKTHADIKKGEYTEKGEYFGKQMVLIIKVVSDVAAQIPGRLPEEESRE
jgi:hypothetical protein